MREIGERRRYLLSDQHAGLRWVAALSFLEQVVRFLGCWWFHQTGVEAEGDDLLIDTGGGDPSAGSASGIRGGIEQERSRTFGGALDAVFEA